MSLKSYFVSTNMANSKLVFNGPIKGTLLIYFPASFQFEYKHVSIVAIPKSKFSTFLILCEGCSTSLEKQFFFLKCKCYFSEKILPGKLCLKCESFRKLQTPKNLRLQKKNTWTVLILPLLNLQLGSLSAKTLRFQFHFANPNFYMVT